MDTRNSQKKSPRNSTTSKRETSSMPEAPGYVPTDADRKEHMDYSADHVARVRAAKAAAQRAMEAFGDPSEYDVVILQGRLKEEPAASPSQSPLDFQDELSDKPKGTD